MLVDFRVICMKYLWLPCSYAGFTNQILSSTWSETSSFRGSQTFNKCDASVRDEVNRVPHVKGAQFWLPAVFVVHLYSTRKRAVLAWRKFPICHYSQHGPLPLALYFRICPWAGQGDTWEQYSGQSVFTGLFLSIRQSLSDARRLLVHILHTVSPEQLWQPTCAFGF